MPTRARRARSAGVKMPLSPTINAVARDLRREPLADGERWSRRSCRLRLLMPISRERSLQRALEFGFVVHLDQHVHAEGERRVLEVLRRGVVDAPP